MSDYRNIQASAAVLCWRTELRFVDQRTFWSDVAYHWNLRLCVIPGLAKLGLDPNASDFSVYLSWKTASEPSPN